MSTVKGFWQHTNGLVYALESSSFGKIMGAAGPLHPNDLHDLADYEYRITIIDWVEKALTEDKLHRINPKQVVCK